MRACWLFPLPCFPPQSGSFSLPHVWFFSFYIYIFFHSPSRLALPCFKLGTCIPHSPVRQSRKYWFNAPFYGLVLRLMFRQSWSSGILESHTISPPRLQTHSKFRELACYIELHDRNSVVFRWVTVKRPNFSFFLKTVFHPNLLHDNRLFGLEFEATSIPTYSLSLQIAFHFERFYSQWYQEFGQNCDKEMVRALYTKNLLSVLKSTHNAPFFSLLFVLIHAIYVHFLFESEMLLQGRWIY